MNRRIAANHRLQVNFELWTNKLWTINYGLWTMD